MGCNTGRGIHDKGYIYIYNSSRGKGGEGAHLVVVLSA